jgi:hypothetical protein
LEICREEINRWRETSVLIGVDYNTLLNGDIRFYSYAVRGYLKRREIWINDMLSVGHMVAGKHLQGFSGNKKFQKPIEPVVLVKPDAAEKRRKRAEDAAYFEDKSTMDIFGGA